MRFCLFAILFLLISPTAFGFQADSADFDKSIPTLHGFSHPRVTNQNRSQLGLRNLSASEASLEVLMLAGAPWSNCKLLPQTSRRGSGSYQHRRYGVSCHETPLFGAFISSHGTEQEPLLIQGAIPKGEASFVSWDEALNEGEIREQLPPHQSTSKPQKFYFYQDDYGLVIPAYQYTIWDQRSLPWRVLLSALDGQILFKAKRGLHAINAYTYQVNSEVSPLEEVTLARLSPEQSTLDGHNFLVYGADEFSPRATADNQMFPYLPEDETLFDQVQSYYSLERARSFLEQYFPLEEDKALEVYTHSYLDNNAVYLPADGPLPAAIYLGLADGVHMQNLNRDSDVVIHEYSHHVVFRYLTATWGESLSLHEGTADFFAYVINQDPDLGETIMVNRPFLRSATIEEGRKHDHEAQGSGSHLMGQFWSSLLWDLYQENPEMDMFKLISNSLNYWHERADLETAVAALVHSDQELNAGALKCQILSTAFQKGFYKALMNQPVEECGLSSSELHSQVVVLDSSKGNQRGPMVGCGSLGLVSQQPFYAIILLSPLLLFLRRKRHEA